MSFTLIEKEEWRTLNSSSPFIKNFCWESESCVAAGHYLSSKLWPLGDIRLVGSAKKGKAYYQNHLHDIDAVLFTDIEDSSFIADYIYKAIKDNWSKDFELDLDIFCYGNFKRHIRTFPLPLNRAKKKVKLNVYFTHPRMRIWEYLRTKIWKLLHSRPRKS